MNAIDSFKISEGDDIVHQSLTQGAMRDVFTEFHGFKPNRFDTFIRTADLENEKMINVNEYNF